MTLRYKETLMGTAEELTQNNPTLPSGTVIVEFGGSSIRVGDGVTPYNDLPNYGVEGPSGKSAYEIAVENGYTGTEQEWADSFSNAAQYASEAESARDQAKEYADAVQGQVPADFSVLRIADLYSLSASSGAIAFVAENGHFYQFTGITWEDKGEGFLSPKADKVDLDDEVASRKSLIEKLEKDFALTVEDGVGQAAIVVTSAGTTRISRLEVPNETVFEGPVTFETLPDGLLPDYSESISELGDRVEDNNAAVLDLGQRVSNSETNLDTLSSDVANTQNDVSSLSVSVGALAQSSADQLQSISDLESASTQLTTDVSSLSSGLSYANQKLEDEVSERKSLVDKTDAIAFSVEDGGGNSAIFVDNVGTVTIPTLESGSAILGDGAITVMGSEEVVVSAPTHFSSEVTFDVPPELPVEDQTTYSVVDWPANLVAFWDFSGDAAPYKTKYGVSEFPLVLGSASAPQKIAEGPFGQSLRFTGSEYLAVREANLGRLNLAARGDEVTVVGWVRRTNTGQHFVAGVWQENNNDPRRQYGLFLNLPLYGGPQQVIGHISDTGGASPGYPYSRDYSASAQTVTPNEWHMVAFTYDGEEIISYLDGVADSRPVYTDGLGNTYRKNPYDFDGGLNRVIEGDFTVGGVLLTHGMSNMLVGDLSGVAIFGRALTKKELMDLHMQTVKGSSFVKQDFWTTSTYSNRSASSCGWKSYEGDTCTDTSDNTSAAFIQYYSTQGCLARGASTGLSMAFYDTIHSNRIQQLKKVTFDLNNSSSLDGVNLVLRVGGKTYVSVATFYSARDGGSAANWTTNKTSITFPIDRAPENWRELTFNVGTSLAIGENPLTSLSGELTGVGFLTNALSGTARIANLNLHRES